MSLIRQVWWLLIGMLVFAYSVGMGSHVWATHQALQLQVQARNDEGAMVLAVALSQLGGDEQRMQRVASTLFDGGHYRRLRVLSENGQPWFERDSVEPGAAVPKWLAHALAAEARPGVAEVTNGWKPLGSVELWGQTDWAADTLWSGSMAIAGWLALFGAATLALSWSLMRAWQRPLMALVSQAQALDERRFALVDEPKVPELRRLARSINFLLRRLQAVLAGQAARLEELRKQAHTDPITGLANRRRFIGSLNTALSAGSHRGAGLLIVRMLDLSSMSQRIGHAATDRLLGALGEELQAYPRRVAGALTGRLNGSDFALYLPASGLAGDTARSLVNALRGALATVDLGAELVVGGTDGFSMTSGADMLTRADMALARAEERGGFSIEVAGVGAVMSPASVGEDAWRQRLSRALAGGRSRLAEFPLLDAAGRLLQLECSLHLQWNDAEAFQPASSWRAMALRCRLGPQMDLAALSLALEAITRDGLPRSIHMSAASLASAGFVSAVAERLATAPQQAARVSIDLPVAAARRHRERLRQASAQWRRAGVRLGLEHAGANATELPLLQSLGVDYIKVDAAFVQDVARDPEVREFARGLASLLRGMGIQAFAEGVASDEDLVVLWQLGFAGASGPGVRLALSASR